MRDFTAGDINGIVTIHDSSEYGQPLATLSNEELVHEEEFRRAQLRRERGMRWKQLLLVLAVALILASAAYITHAVWGDWNPANILMAACSAAIAYAGLYYRGLPSRFEKEHADALRVIHDLYRLRGYNPRKQR